MNSLLQVSVLIHADEARALINTIILDISYQETWRKMHKWLWPG